MINGGEPVRAKNSTSLLISTEPEPAFPFSDGTSFGH